MILTYDSPGGKLVLGAREGKLYLCDWEESVEKLCKIPIIESKFAEIENYFWKNPEKTDKADQREENQLCLDLTVSQLNSYFSEKLKIFSIPTIYPSKTTEFQKLVFEGIKQVSYGETISYKYLAKKIGSPQSVRAVANACGKNPLAIIIPCHRIVASSSSQQFDSKKLGGYTGGLPRKKLLLSIEKILREPPALF